jgi:hypothetical protein
MGVTHFDGLDAVSAGLWIGGVQVTATPAELNVLTVAGLTATGAQLNALQAEAVARLTTPQVIRTNVTAALVHAGATAVVPAVAGKRFQVLSIAMRAVGGAVSGATTVGVKEDGGSVFLSQAAAGLTDGTWHNTVTGTPVITGMTSGGMTAVANKALLAYDAGGILAGTVTMDFIVAGYYTTT